MSLFYYLEQIFLPIFCLRCFPPSCFFLSQLFFYLCCFSSISSTRFLVRSTSLVAVTTCLRTRTTSSWTYAMWRRWKQGSMSCSRGSLGWTTGAWRGSGFTCYPMRCSTPTMGCLSTQQGNYCLEGNFQGVRFSCISRFSRPLTMKISTVLPLVEKFNCHPPCLL